MTRDERGAVRNEERHGAGDIPTGDTSGTLHGTGDSDPDAAPEHPCRAQPAAAGHPQCRSGQQPAAGSGTIRTAGDVRPESDDAGSTQQHASVGRITQPCAQRPGPQRRHAQERARAGCTRAGSPPVKAAAPNVSPPLAMSAFSPASAPVTNPPSAAA